MSTGIREAAHVKGQEAALQHLAVRSSRFSTFSQFLPDICGPHPSITRLTKPTFTLHLNSDPAAIVHPILRRIFGPKRDENGEWRRLHSAELHSLYRSPNVVRMIKSRRLRWAGHVCRKVGVLSKF